MKKRMKKFRERRGLQEEKRLNSDIKGGKKQCPQNIGSSKCKALKKEMHEGLIGS